jgi:hypothetical protein
LKIDFEIENKIVFRPITLKETKTIIRITLSERVKAVIESLGNTTRRDSGLKIYAALYERTNRADKHGYFDCPSTYLKSVNDKYAGIIKRFIKDGLIKRKERLKQDPNDIFNTIRTETYSKHLGRCMKYKFLIDITEGEEIEIDFDNHRKYRWYEILKTSLMELGYIPKITRDNFGRRVYHPAIMHYKTELANIGLAVIDAKASQPTLLWLIMKERNIVDPNYNSIFETNLDFYQYVCDELKLADRDAAKNLFMFWVNSKGYVPDAGIHILFSIASKFIKKLKAGNFKDSPAFLQQKEAAIWIDDLLENIPVEFALPIHDSLIVKQEHLEQVLAYCKTKYPELRFETKLL